MPSLAGICMLFFEGQVLGLAGCEAALLLSGFGDWSFNVGQTSCLELEDTWS